MLGIVGGVMMRFERGEELVEETAAAWRVVADGGASAGASLGVVRGGCAPGVGAGGGEAGVDLRHLADRAQARACVCGA